MSKNTCSIIGRASGLIWSFSGSWYQTSKWRVLLKCEVVGLTGLEPVTLRLSSACSNQLSYTPNRSLERVSVEASERANFTLLRSTL